MSSEKIGCGSIIGAVILASIIVGSCSSPKEIQDGQQQQKTSWVDKQDPMGAYVMIQDRVKSRLKAPSTSKFPWYNDRGVNVAYLGNYEYRVIGYVDAQNSFGAQIRTKYAGIMRQTGEHEWQLVELAVF